MNKPEGGGGEDFLLNVSQNYHNKKNQRLNLLQSVCIEFIEYTSFTIWVELLK